MAGYGGTLPPGIPLTPTRLEGALGVGEGVSPPGNPPHTRPTEQCPSASTGKPTTRKQPSTRIRPEQGKTFGLDFWPRFTFETCASAQNLKPTFLQCNTA